MGFFSFGQDSAISSSLSNDVSLLNNQNEIQYKSLNTIDPDTIKGKELRDVPWFVNRFKVSAGFFESINTTEIRVGNGSGSIGTDIDFEDDLGFDKYSPSFFADIQWRSTSRSRFNLTYYNIRRNANKKIQKTIDFGDNTYDINTEVYANFNSAIYRFSYGYAILSKPKYELGLSIGLHVIDYGVTLGIKGTNLNLEKRDNYSIAAPLPDFGLWGGYAISNRFALTGEIDYFAVEVQNINGRVIASNFLVVFKALDKLDLTTGFSTLGVRVDSSTDRVNGYVNWGNTGIILKATYNFGKNKWK